MADHGEEVPVLGADRPVEPDGDRPFGDEDAVALQDWFQAQYQRFFGRAIEGLDGLEIEVVTWSVKARDDRPPSARHELTTGRRRVPVTDTRAVFDPATGSVQTYAIAEREALAAGDRLNGPAVIVERETSTVITTSFDAVLQDDGAILLIRKGSQA